MEELSFSLCELNDSIRRVLLQCVQLRKLTIQSDSNLTGSCLAIKFPQLESITLIMNSDIEMRHLYSFFKLNPQLKAVTIIHCGGCIFDGCIFDEIVIQNSENFRSLNLIFIFRNFSKDCKRFAKIRIAYN